MHASSSENILHTYYFVCLDIWNDNIEGRSKKYKLIKQFFINGVPN